MLKALDDLERAVGQLVEKARKDETDVSARKGASDPSGGIVSSLEAVQTGPDNQEAAELIRRAIKRLRSL